MTSPGLELAPRVVRRGRFVLPGSSVRHDVRNSSQRGHGMAQARITSAGSVMTVCAVSPGRGARRCAYTGRLVSGPTGVHCDHRVSDRRRSLRATPARNTVPADRAPQGPPLSDRTACIRGQVPRRAYAAQSVPDCGARRASHCPGVAPCPRQQFIEDVQRRLHWPMFPMSSGMGKTSPLPEFQA